MISRTATDRPRRVLLGLGGDGEVGSIIEAAFMLASGLGANLKCVVVEREELLAAASLPFCQAVSYGGVSAPMLPAHISLYFRGLARTLEKALLARCAGIGIGWSLDLPQGDYLRELSTLAEEGDILVLSPRDISLRAEPFAALFGSLLGKASAVVIPGGNDRDGRKIIALSTGAAGGKAAGLADAIANILRKTATVIPPQELDRHLHDAAILVVPVGLAALLGGSALIRAIRSTRTTLILVPE